MCVCVCACFHYSHTTVRGGVCSHIARNVKWSGHREPVLTRTNQLDCGQREPCPQAPRRGQYGRQRPLLAHCMILRLLGYLKRATRHPSSSFYAYAEVTLYLHYRRPRDLYAVIPARVAQHRPPGRGRPLNPSLRAAPHPLPARRARQARARVCVCVCFITRIPPYEAGLSHTLSKPNQCAARTAMRCSSKQINRRADRQNSAYKTTIRFVVTSSILVSLA